MECAAPYPPMPSPLPPQDPIFDLDQLHLALDMSEVSIWRMDILTQRVHANAAGFRVVGQAPRLNGWTIDEMMRIIHPDDHEAVVAAAHQARIEKRPVELMVRFHHTDGSWRRMITRRVPIRDAQGQLLAFFGMAIDVSERLRAEEPDPRAVLVLPNPPPAAEATVLTLTVPTGLDGVIKKYSNNLTGGGFVNGSGDIIWRIRRNGRAIRNFDNILFESGTVDFPRELAAGIRIYSNDIITFTVEHVANAALAGNVICSFVGYFYPALGS